MMADDLIDLARELENREAGRPKSVSLRRAVSSAYYGLFHALAYLCADQSIGWRRPYDLFTPIYRSLDHGRARSALSAIRQQGQRGTPTEVVALAFAALQDARHDADYSPESFSFNRGGALELIGVAERAIVAVNTLSADEKLTLAVKLVFKSR